MPRLTPEQKTKKLNKILDHIRLNYYLYKKYPTFVCIENKFHTNLRTHGLNIRKLYRLANIPYKRDPNPFLRYKKERKLTEITKKLFQKLGYNIKNTSIGPSKPIGADIVLEDEQKRLIPLEIKAYQKFGKIGQSKYSPYIRDEINQLKGYIKHLYASHGYLVTSTDRRTLKSVPENIKIIFGQDLKKLLLQFRMHKELKDLDWVRNSSISYGKKEYKRKVAKKILNYVKKKMNQGKYVGEREIHKKFQLNPGSYFSEGMRGIYKKLDKDPELIPNYRMGRKFDKEKFRQIIINFVKAESQRGCIPTYKKIQKKFRCLPKLFFPGGIREIAQLAGIKYSSKFANKTPWEKARIRQKIIKYATRKLKSGFFPGYLDIESMFRINFQHYFKNPEELYQKAGYNGPVKKTWKNFVKNI